MGALKAGALIASLGAASIYKSFFKTTQQLALRKKTSLSRNVQFDEIPTLTFICIQSTRSTPQSLTNRGAGWFPPAAGTPGPTLRLSANHSSGSSPRAPRLDSVSTPARGRPRSWAGVPSCAQTLAQSTGSCNLTSQDPTTAHRTQAGGSVLQTRAGCPRLPSSRLGRLDPQPGLDRVQCCPA